MKPRNLLALSAAAAFLIVFLVMNALEYHLGVSVPARRIHLVMLCVVYVVLLLYSFRAFQHERNCRAECPVCHKPTTTYRINLGTSPILICAECGNCKTSQHRR
jgi:hypothetical protein